MIEMQLSNQPNQKQRRFISPERDDKSMKRLAVMILTCITMTILCACGKNEIISEEKSITEVGGAGKVIKDSIKDLEGSSKEKEADEEQNTIADDNKQDDIHEDLGGEILSEPDWKTAYLSYLDIMEAASNYTYSLIYVDEDDIPELLMDSGFEAGGCKILTFHDGVVDEWQSSRLNVTYIEKGNLICNSDGLMGCYYDYIFTIRDGKWCPVEGGEWGYEWPAEEMIYTYKWNGTEVSEDEYKTYLNEVYPQERQRRPERYYILKEMLSILKTGDVTSAGHRYELMVEDLTWEEAAALCREKGGYLATITSWEEMERIQDQIISEKKSNITFFVGANNKDEENSFGYHWIESESQIVYYSMLSFYKALFENFWLEGEPSYTGLTESGVEVDEDYVVLFYRKSDDRCYLNDVPDDILSAAPSYSGRVGYICEYEN